MVFLLSSRPITRFTEVLYSQGGYFKNRTWLAFGPRHAAQTRFHLDSLGLGYLVQELPEQPLFNFDYLGRTICLMHVEALTAQEMRAFLNYRRARFVAAEVAGELSREQVQEFLAGSSPFKRISLPGGEVIISRVYNPRLPVENKPDISSTGPRVTRFRKRRPRRS